MIPGLTTRNRLPRLGKIRLGEKRKSQGGKEYPAALDHFNLTDVPEVQSVYGEECREIFPVILPAEDEEVWFPTARKAYRASGLFCACDDGETARRVYVPVEDGKGDPQGEAYIKETGLAVEPGEMFEMPCPGESCPYFEQGLCKNVGRLMIMLPNVPRFGVYEITTSSCNSIINVLSTARAIRSLAGRISGIPLALRLGPQQVQANGKSKTVHVLSLEFRGSIWDLQRAKERLTGGQIIGLIEGGKDLTPDDLYPAAGGKLEAKLTPPAAPAPAAPPVQTREPGDDYEEVPDVDDEPPLDEEPEQLGLDPHALKWRGKIAGLSSKQGPKAIRYGIKGEGDVWFNHFSKTLQAEAEAAKKRGDVVDIMYEDTKYGKDVINLRTATGFHGAKV